MEKNYTQHLWQVITPIYNDIIQHPFIQQLSQGQLSPEIFAHYLQQDALYLADFARALVLAGNKAHGKEAFLACIEFAKGALMAETQLHEYFFKQLNIKPAQQKSPSCLTYTQFLIDTCTHQPFEQSIAALLPCFWIYREVGFYIQSQSSDENPYKPWIETYAGVEFNRAVEKAIDITNNAASQANETTLQTMEQSFITSSQLEWAFWDSAYHSSAKA
jgi:thiaminase/transcriptional activator TenA